MASEAAGVGDAAGAGPWLAGVGATSLGPLGIADLSGLAAGLATFFGVGVGVAVGVGVGVGLGMASEAAGVGDAAGAGPWFAGVGATSWGPLGIADLSGVAAGLATFFGAGVGVGWWGRHGLRGGRRGRRARARAHGSQASAQCRGDGSELPMYQE